MPNDEKKKEHTKPEKALVCNCNHEWKAWVEKSIKALEEFWYAQGKSIGMPEKPE
jgi:hypothetical protein